MFPLTHDSRILVDGGGVLHGLARADELRDTVDVESLGHGEGGLSDHEAGGVDAEVVLAGDDAGQAVHEDVLTAGRDDVEDDSPALAFRIGRPVAVSDDDFAVPGGRAGGDKGAALAWGDSGGGIYLALLSVDHGQVVVAELDIAIESDDVPEIKPGAGGLEAFGDSLEFFLIFGLDSGPEDGLCGVAEEAPGVFVLMGRGDGVDVDVVFDFVGEDVAVLEADLLGCSLEVDVGPAALIEFVGVFEAGIVRCRCAGGCGQSSQGDKDNKREGQLSGKLKGHAESSGIPRRYHRGLSFERGYRLKREVKAGVFEGIEND